jgi:DNA helicase HerA-like ATPase
MDFITLDDLAGLQDELSLSEAGLVAAGQLERRLGPTWMAQLIAMDADELKEITKSIGAHEGAVDGLRRKLQQRIERLSFVVRDLGHLPNGIDDMIKALETGRNVVLQFGKNSSLLAYMLVANLITRRIHARWVELTEQAEQKGDKAPPLMITIEEAHKFLSQGQSIFSTIARELRKYSVTLLIVDQRPSSIDPDVMSQLGTRITALLSDERDIDAVFTGTRGGHFKNILATLDTKQEVLVFGHAVPMEVVLRTRNFDESLYRAVAPDAGRSKQERAQNAYDDLFGPG